MSDNSSNGHHNQPHLDAGSFVSATLGFGSLMKDKLETFQIGSRRELSSQELFTLYESSNFIANAINSVPDASCQKYCEYQSNVGAQEIQAELNRLKLHVNQAWKLARLQGWAAVLLLIDDGEVDYRQPVNARSIRGISGYNALSGGASGEISVTEWDEDPLSPTYGEPLLFAIANTTAVVHVSRLLLFYGIKRLSRYQARSQGQLGTSIINRCYQEFRNFDVENNSIAATLPDFNLDIFEISGLANLLARQKDFAEYVSGMAFARSVLKVMLVEAGADGQNQGGYKILARQYTGVRELLEYYKQIFAGSTDIPNVLLFNESPSGTTSGKFEMRSWSQYIANQQQSELDPALRKLIECLHNMKGNEPDNHW